MSSPLAVNLAIVPKMCKVHAARDKILLEQDAYHGYSDDGDDDEVFALKGIPDGSESVEENEDFGDLDQDKDWAKKEEPASTTKKAGKRKKSKKVDEESKPWYDEENQEEAEESWGHGKAAYYSSNADQLDSDDEEGHEQEEQEGIRLQAISRQDLQDEDFGLNDELNSQKRPEVE